MKFFLGMIGRILFFGMLLALTIHVTIVPIELVIIGYLIGTIHIDVRDYMRNRGW